MRTAHLSDDRLVELYFTDTPSAREQQHLGACPDCDHRRSEMAHLLDETAQASAEDLDAAFPADRLARQQLQILERAELAAGPARVIAFPAAPSPSTSVSSRTRWTSRWVAAAAAAGLLVGIVAGRAGRSDDGAGTPSRISAAQAVQDTGPAIRTVSAPLSDDEFLVELESAIESGGGGDALYALDQLTPRSWDR